jgi:signal transduction histidine kinase
MIRSIIESVDNAYGDDFFQQICLKLNAVVKADYTFVARFDTDNFMAETVVVVANGKVVDNFEYSLKDTPCADLLDHRVCTYESQVADMFPNDLLLADMGIEGYIGASLKNSKDKVFGLITALYESDIESPSLTETLLQVFSGRIASELERFEYERSLEEMNQQLEHKVLDRTQQLTSALQEMELMQAHLVESEKMAALGGLVAGVAHEVNTPLGVAITAQSHLYQKCRELKLKFDNENLKRSDLHHFIDMSESTLLLLEKNLLRAETLISNFKQVSTDQSAFHTETINLHRYYAKILSSLSPLLNSEGVTLKFECDHSIRVETLPGAHAQVLTNMVNNSIKHGFGRSAISNKKITITIEQTEQGICVFYGDNGRGIPHSIADKIFEPFFTTNRADGATGLGLSICYNLITVTLGGQLSLVECLEGCRFKYCFSD